MSTSYASLDHKVVDLQGDALKVLKALEAVLGHLRKFLIDRSVLPLFEMTVSYSHFKSFMEHHIIWD